MSIILSLPTFHLNHIELENDKKAIVLSWSWEDSQGHFFTFTFSFLKYVLAIYKTLVLLYSQNLSKPLLTLAWSYTVCVTKSWLKNIQHGTRLPPHQPKPCPICIICAVANSSTQREVGYSTNRLILPQPF